MNRFVSGALLSAVMVALLLFCLASCAGLWHSMKGTAAPAIGGAGGAAVGSLAGPVGTIAGAGIGAAVGHNVGENADLRAGNLVGGDAVDREWHRAGRTPPPDPWYLTMRGWVWIAAGYFAWRNRSDLMSWWSARGGTAKVTAMLKGVTHSIVGGNVCRRPTRGA